MLSRDARKTELAHRDEKSVIARRCYSPGTGEYQHRYPRRRGFQHTHSTNEPPGIAADGTPRGTMSSRGNYRTRPAHTMHRAAWGRTCNLPRAISPWQLVHMP